AGLVEVARLHQFHPRVEECIRRRAVLRRSRECFTRLPEVDGAESGADERSAPDAFPKWRAERWGRALGKQVQGSLGTLPLVEWTSHWATGYLSRDLGKRSDP